MQRKTILSAVQPSSGMTLGNYVGALRHWVRLQDEYRCFFFVGDLHAMTGRPEAGDLRSNVLLAAATYIGVGLDPGRCKIFLQSHVREHTELAWVLGCHCYMGELGRMTQFKDKSTRAGQNVPTGLFTYPLLMAADILLYDADLVPVGADQRQHLELTRDLASRLNNRWGEDTLRVPEAYIAPVGSRIMDLQDPAAKMSKSAASPAGVVFLTDTPEQIRKKVKRAVTDSGSEITDNPEQAGVRNLLEIQCSLTGQPMTDVVARYAGKQYGHLKVDTAEVVVEALRPIQGRIAELLSDRAELARILERGAEGAREVASVTLRRVYERAGIIVPSRGLGSGSV